MTRTHDTASADRPTTVRRVLGWLSNLVLIGCVLLFLALAVGPHLFGYRTSTMLTGSMEPGISPGDVVVTVPKPASEVAVGDVITYHIPVEDHRVETHRITQVKHRADGTVAVRTKGDANENVDPWVANLEGDTVWEVVVVVPELGGAIRTLRAPVVREVVLWGALGGMILLGLSLIWARGSDPDQPPADEDVLDGSALLHLVSDLGVGTTDPGRRFADRYREMLPRRIDRVVEALAVGDAEVALDAVLSLKVSSMTVGAVELADVAQLLEARVRAADLRGARAVADDLLPAADRVDHALTAYLAA